MPPSVCTTLFPFAIITAPIGLLCGVRQGRLFRMDRGQLHLRRHAASRGPLAVMHVLWRRKGEGCGLKRNNLLIGWRKRRTFGVAHAQDDGCTKQSYDYML